MIRPDFTKKISRVINLLVVCSMLLCCTPVFASGWRTQYMAEIRGVFNTILVIGRVCSVVVLAFGGIEFMIANGAKNQYEQKLEKAKTRIIYALIALAALYLLPAMVRMGIDIGKAYRWNPDPSTW